MQLRTNALAAAACMLTSSCCRWAAQGSGFASMPAHSWKEVHVEEFFRSIEMDTVVPKLAENDVGERARSVQHPGS